MAKPEYPEPVKLIVAVLLKDENFLQLALDELSKLYGVIDFKGERHAFDLTDYYADEMGENLQRQIFSFEKLFASENIGQAKLSCNEIEDKLLIQGKRKVNLDIGYLDHNKFVLASNKFAGQKIHLGLGIYADLIARYKKGAYQPFEWSFLDFKDGRYSAELNEIRKIYLMQRR